MYLRIYVQILLIQSESLSFKENPIVFHALTRKTINAPCFDYEEQQISSSLPSHHCFTVVFTHQACRNIVNMHAIAIFPGTNTLGFSQVKRDTIAF